MAAAARKHKESTGRWATFFEVFLGILSGVLICAVWLVLKPVQVVDAMPAPARKQEGKPVDLHRVYFVRGHSDGRGAQYGSKQNAVLDRDPQGVEWTEEEINRWINATYGRADLSVENEDFGAAASIGLPSVHLDGDRVVLGSDVAVSFAGIKRTIMAQARGRFVRQADGFAFVPERVTLGSCPVWPVLGGSSAYRSIRRMFTVSDNIQSAWREAEDVRVAEGRIRVGFAAPAEPEIVVAPAAPDVTAPAAEPAAAAMPDAAVETPAAATAAEPPVTMSDVTAPDPAPELAPPVPAGEGDIPVPAETEADAAASASEAPSPAVQTSDTPAEAAPVATEPAAAEAAAPSADPASP